MAMPISTSSADKPLWGPWSPDLTDPAECKAQLRLLAGIVHMMTHGGADDLVRELRRAEPTIVIGPIMGDYDHAMSPYCDALERARRMFDALPALTQRRIIATFSAVNHLKTYKSIDSV